MMMQRQFSDHSKPADPAWAYTSAPRHGVKRGWTGFATAYAALAALAGSAFAIDVAEAAPRQGARSSGQQAQQAAPRGQVFLNGRWVSSSWCDATVPGPDGGPGGPGRGLCNASTPRR